MYWIVNNDYNHLGPYSWITQTHMDFVAGGVSLQDDHAPYTNGPLVVPYDSWFQMRADYDLTAGCKVLRVWSPQTMAQPMIVATGPVYVPAWTANPVLAIDNLDLYTTGGTYYVDDVSLVRLAPNGASLYQVDNPLSSLTCNGVFGTACLPGASSVLVGSNGSFNWASTLFTPFDTAAMFEPAYPAAFVTPGNSIVNINLASPTLIWVNTLTSVVSLQGFPVPGFSFPFVPTAGGVTLTGQMIILDPAVVDSFRLSQPATLIVP
jgi:hypothetical protein